jgi:hypothetical protein
MNMQPQNKTKHGVPTVNMLFKRTKRTKHGLIHTFRTTGFFFTLSIVRYSTIRKNTTFRKLDLFPSSAEGTEDTCSLGPCQYKINLTVNMLFKRKKQTKHGLIHEEEEGGGGDDFLKYSYLLYSTIPYVVAIILGFTSGRSGFHYKLYLWMFK